MRIAALTSKATVRLVEGDSRVSCGTIAPCGPSDERRHLVGGKRLMKGRGRPSVTPSREHTL